MRIEAEYGLNDYRKSLIASMFYKYVLSILPNLPSKYKSATQHFVREVSSGSETYQTDPSGTCHDLVANSRL